MVAVRTATLTQADGSTWTFTTAPDPSASQWVIEDVTGWYGGSGVRGDLPDRLGHGNFAPRAWRTNRALTLKGYIVCPDSDVRDWQERDLSGMAWSADWGTLTCDEGGRTLSTSVRLDGAPQVVKAGTLSLLVQVPLIADSPFLYGPERVSFLQPVNAGVGLEFPLFDAGILSFGSGIIANDPVTNDGNADAWPTYLVVGDFPGGFRVTVENRVVEWPWPTRPASPVEIRMAGSVWIGTSNVTDQATVREWTPIVPHGTVSPTLSPLQGGSGWCEVHHQDTYM